jgi:hypothetical protein
MEPMKCDWSHQRHYWHLWSGVESPLVEKDTDSGTRIAGPRVVNLEEVNKGTILG